MTKIHPEAAALLNKHCGVTRGLNGMIHNGPATEAISQALFERDALKGAADAVYNRLMPEVETLRAQVAEMREALKGVCRERNAEWFSTEVNGVAIKSKGESVFMRETEVQRHIGEIYKEINAILSKDNSND